jgi:hypothetical protein
VVWESLVEETFMGPDTQTAPVSNKMLWAGWIISALPGLCLKSPFNSESGVAVADWAAAYYSQVQPHRTFEAKRPAGTDVPRQRRDEIREAG